MTGAIALLLAGGPGRGLGEVAGVLGLGARELLAALALNALYAAILYAAARCFVTLWSDPATLAARLPGGLGGWLARRLPRPPGRELPPAVELALWSAVAVRLVLPPGLAAPWSLRSLVRSAGSLLGLGTAGAGPVPALDPSLLLGPLASGADGANAGASTGLGTATPWVLALAGLWLVGASACIVRFVRARRQVWRRIVAGRVLDDRCPADRSLLRTVARWRRVFGIRRPVRVVVGRGDGSPCTLGVLRPVIWLPERFVATGRDERSAAPTLAEAALAHELVHVHGLDDLWLRLLATVRALFLFHPVAWWVSARLVDARERAVDDAVLGRGLVTARTYGRALLSTLAGNTPGERSIHPADRALFPAFGSPKRSTPMRIHRIVRRHAANRSPKRRRLVACAAVSTALVALAALPMAAAPVGVSGQAAHAARSGPSAHPVHAAQAGTAHWASPVHQARVTSPFGERPDPFRSGDVSKHHDGVDLGAAAGTPILAPADGVVTVATEHYRPSPHWGTVIVVDHGGGLQTRYAHLGSLAVTEGQKVRRGDTLGAVGATGRVTGPHLHFEVLRDGEPVDPATFVADLAD